MSDSNDVLLKTQGLTRRLSEHAGVFDLSLSLSRGDVLGLLGLNGAGKSTTLKLLSGTLVPDSGDIFVSRFSMHEQPLEARARIGYLPDQPPLYNDMRVKDYLMLCAKLRRVVKAELKDSVDQVIQLCDLNEVATARITKLSKGFRQRVGLAQALVHKPDVLLLDEPSNGLDPQQMQGMREILQSATQNQAVVFSTHLLHEAQAVCTRVAVVSEGRIVHQSNIKESDADLETLFNGLLHEQKNDAMQETVSP